MAFLRLLTVMLGIALSVAFIAPAPAQAGKVGRALGIIGGVAVGAIILNEATKPRRSDQQARRRVKEQTTQSRSESEPEKGDSRTAGSEGEATITQETKVGGGAAGGDPFAGVSSTRETKSED